MRDVPVRQTPLRGMHASTGYRYQYSCVDFIRSRVRGDTQKVKNTRRGPRAASSQQKGGWVGQKDQVLRGRFRAKDESGLRILLRDRSPAPPSPSRRNHTHSRFHLPNNKLFTVPESGVRVNASRPSRSREVAGMRAQPAVAKTRRKHGQRA